MKQRSGLTSDLLHVRCRIRTYGSGKLTTACNSQPVQKSCMLVEEVEAAFDKS